MTLYQIVIDDAALEQLRGLPKGLRRSIGYRLSTLQNAFQGDVKKLEGDTAAIGFESAIIASCSDWTAM